MCYYKTQADPQMCQFTHPRAARLPRVCRWFYSSSTDAVAAIFFFDRRFFLIVWRQTMVRGT